MRDPERLDYDKNAPRRRGVELSWVVGFIAAVAVALLVTIIAGIFRCSTAEWRGALGSFDPPSSLRTSASMF